MFLFRGPAVIILGFCFMRKENTISNLTQSYLDAHQNQIVTLWK